MKAPGSPAWRKAGRPPKGEMPVHPPKPRVDVSDLEQLDDEELNRVVAREALIGLMAVARRPTRHAVAKTSALREAIAYTKAKPEQKTVNKHEGGLEIRVTRVAQD